MRGYALLITDFRDARDFRVQRTHRQCNHDFVYYAVSDERRNILNVADARVPALAKLFHSRPLAVDKTQHTIAERRVRFEGRGKLYRPRIGAHDQHVPQIATVLSHVLEHQPYGLTNRHRTDGADRPENQEKAWKNHA